MNWEYYEEGDDELEGDFYDPESTFTVEEQKGVGAQSMFIHLGAGELEKAIAVGKVEMLFLPEVTEDEKAEKVYCVLELAKAALKLGRLEEAW